jgi:hypothetical protein
VADLYYYEEGYIDDKYHVYVADAEIALGPYIEENYIDANYYDDYSSVASLTCELTLRPGETVSATGTWTSAFTQTALVGRLQSVSAAFTSAFSPTLTVDAFKNSFAVLDVTVALSSTAVATRSVNVLLEHIADLNAMAAKTVDILSPITATATLSSAPVKSLVSSATLASTATLSCLALKLKITSANVSSIATFYAGRLIRAGRPRPYTQVGTPTLDTGSKKFGAASARLNYTNHITVPASADWSRIKTVDFWFNIPNPTEFDGLNGSFLHSALTWYTDTNNNRSVGFFSQNVGIKFGVISASYSARIAGVDYYHNLDFGAGISYNTWRHFRLLDDGSAITMWLDGVKQNPVAVNYTSAGIGFNQTLRIGHNPVGTPPTIRIDELLITRETLTSASTTSFTIPSDRWYPEDQTKILLLSHYDSNYTDDIGEWMTPTLALSSNATISAQANGNTKLATITLNSAVTVTASASRLLEGSADLVTAFTQVTSANRIRLAACDQTAEVTVTVTIGSVKQFVSNQNALFTPSVVVQAQLAGLALLESQFTQTASAVKTTDVESDMTSTASVAVSATVTAGLASVMSSASTVSATVTRIQTVQSELSSAFAITVNNSAIEQYDASLSSEFTCTVIADRFAEYSASLSSAFTSNTQAQRTRDLDSALTSNTAFAATVIRQQQGTSELASAFTHTANGVKDTDVVMAIAVTATQLTLAVKTVDAIPQLESIATQLTAAFKNATGTITLESTATVTALTGAIKRISIGSGIGVDATSEPDSTASPFLRFGNSDTPTPLDGSVSVSNSINQTGKFIMSMWMVKPIGYVFDADPNRTIYTVSGSIEQNNTNNSIQVETFSDAPFFRYRGNTGYVVWPLGPSPRLQTLANYSHYLLSVDITKSTNAQKYRLFKDGVEITGGVVHSLGGVGAGQVDTVRTDPYDIKITAFDQYQLMMNTSGAPLHPDRRDGQGGGYGDSNGVKDNRSGLTQFWWDYDAASYDIDNADYRAKFYNGNYLDLGDQGTATGLARPKHYVRLLNFQDIEEGGTKRSIQTQWNWQKLRVDSSEGTFPVIDYLIAENYTATTDQNSTGILQGIRASFFLTVVSQAVLDNAGSLVSISTLTVLGSFNINNAAELTCTVTQTATATTAIGIVALLSVESTQTAVVGIRKPLSATLTSEATITAIVGATEQFDATVTSQFTLDCDSVIKPPIRTEANLLSQFTVTADPASFTDSITLMMSSGTLTADVIVIPPIRAEADLISTTTLTAVIGSIEQFAVLVMSAGTLTTQATRTRTVTAALICQATVSVTARRVRNAQVSLTAFNTQLTVGEVINLDPYLTYVIPAETRLWKITAESRIIAIEQETRVNIV